MSGRRNNEGLIIIGFGNIIVYYLNNIKQGDILYGKSYYNWKL